MTDRVREIELFYDRGHHHEFLSLSQELAAPGELRQAQTFDFLFKNVEKQYESYLGINVKLRCVTTRVRYPPPLPRLSRLRYCQILYSCNNIETNVGCGEGKGYLGAFFPHAPR